MTSYKQNVTDLLQSCRDLYCDLRIVTSDGFVTCHKALFARMCPPLRTVLKDQDVDEIIVPTFETKTVKLLFDLLYCGELRKITNVDITELKELANILGLRWKMFAMLFSEPLIPVSGFVSDNCLNDIDPLSENIKTENLETEEITTSAAVFDCDYCPTQFSSLQTLVDHFSTHAINKILITNPMVENNFSSLTNPIEESPVIIQPTVNRKRKSDEDLMTCDQCKVVFLEHSVLILHYAQKHNGIDCLQCPFCNERFDNRNSLLQHVHFHKIAYECPDCHEIYSSCGHLRVHVAKFHSRTLTPEQLGKVVVTSKLFITTTGCEDTCRRQCDVCQKWMKNSHALRVHKKSHSGEKTHQCEVCSKMFATYSQWKAHYTRMHSNEKPHVCPICNKAFVVKTELRLHSVVHTGNRKKQCEFCGKKFSNASGLQVHRRTHTGEKPYQCPMCPMKCASSNQLKPHIRTHTGERPYKCKDCGKAFGTNNTLKTHSKVHKNKE